MEKSDVLSYWQNHNNRSYDNKNVVMIKLEVLVVQVIEGLIFEEEEWSFLTEFTEVSNLVDQ